MDRELGQVVVLEFLEEFELEGLDREIFDIFGFIGCLNVILLVGVEVLQVGVD